MTNIYEQIINAADLVLEHSGVMPNRLRAHPLTLQKIEAEVDEYHLVMNHGYRGIQIPMCILMFEPDPQAPQGNLYIDTATL